MVEFFQSSVTQTVLAALNQGFNSYFGAVFCYSDWGIALGLVIAFGSMNRWHRWRDPPVGCCSVMGGSLVKWPVHLFHFGLLAWLPECWSGLSGARL